MTDSISPYHKLEQDIEYALHAHNERVLKGMCVGFRELFKFMPTLQARWRVWSLGFDSKTLHFDQPALDIRLDSESAWYELDPWNGPLVKEVNIYHRRIGVWTQEAEQKIILFKDLPSEAIPYLWDVGGYARLFNFSFYGNISFFDHRAKHWRKTPSKDITKHTYGSEVNGDEDVLLSGIIHKDNYFEAITEINADTGYIEQLKVELFKEELEETVPGSLTPRSVQKI